MILDIFLDHKKAWKAFFEKLKRDQDLVVGGEKRDS